MTQETSKNQLPKHFPNHLCRIPLPACCYSFQKRPPNPTTSRVLFAKPMCSRVSHYEHQRCTKHNSYSCLSSWFHLHSQLYYCLKIINSLIRWRRLAVFSESRGKLFLRSHARLCSAWVPEHTARSGWDQLCQPASTAELLKLAGALAQPGYAQAPGEADWNSWEAHCEGLILVTLMTDLGITRHTEDISLRDPVPCHLWIQIPAPSCSSDIGFAPRSSANIFFPRAARQPAVHY